MPVYQLCEEVMFPPPAKASASGLLAVGGDLSPERLITAYAMGIFPWYDDDSPILWWSPPKRMILLPEEFHCSRSMMRFLRKRPFETSCDTDFRGVIEACADTPRPGQDGTWITRDMIEAYCRLHKMGIAHSFECREQGELVGGLYGVSLGAAFFGESMFSRRTNASKTAFAALVKFATDHGFLFVDCQNETPHLASLGAKPVTRRKFLNMLEKALELPTHQGVWRAAERQP